MAQIPATLNKHIEVVCSLEGGGLVSAANSLTGRYWTGSILYWKDEASVPDIEKCSAGCDVQSSIGDLAVFGGTNILAGTDSGSLELYKIEVDENKESSITCVAQTCEHDDIVNTVSVNASHDKFVSGSSDCRIKIWNVEEVSCVNTYKGHSESINDVTYHPSQGDIFISCAQDGRALLWDTRNPKPAKVIDIGVQDIVTCVEWIPADEHRIVVGTESGTVHVQDVRKAVGAQLTTYPHTRPITRMLFSQKRNEWLATASEDCIVTVQRITNDDLSEIWRGNEHKDFVRCTAWSARDEYLHSCSWDGSIHHRRVKVSAENMETEITLVNGN